MADVSGAFCEQCGNRLQVVGWALVGREADCDVYVSDGAAGVSRYHARIRTDTPHAVADLGSANGTYINGRRISGVAALSPGDVLTLGGKYQVDLSRFLKKPAAASTVYEDPPGAQAPPPPAAVSRPAPPPVVHRRPAEVQPGPQPVVHGPGPVIQARSALACPGCGSENVQTMNMYMQSKKKGGCGCIGCLLILIICILAPVLVLGTAFIAAFALAKFWPYVVGFLGFILFFQIIAAIANANRYICLRCGRRFRP